MEELSLKIDTGAVRVRLYDEYDEELGSFKFIPTDARMIERWEETVKLLGNIMVKENLDENEYKEIESKLSDVIDYLLNYKVSADIFAKCSPLTVATDGDFYFEKVLNGVADCIEKVFNTRLERKKAKINKALEKYNK